jgi:diacylglycerol kinase (ATP)
VRVSLLYNSSAGSALPLDQVRDAIARHGHDLICVVESHPDVRRLLECEPDLVVAAGGDGTIAHAARTLARCGIPLAILPLGTANNIAGSLAIQGWIDDLVAAWHTARRIPLDLGVATGGWGRRMFVEGAGAGLIPAVFSDLLTTPDVEKLQGVEKRSGVIHSIGKVLSRLEPVEMTIVADGARMSGVFLLVEVLNMPLVGSNLAVSASATPSDGLLHVVMAGEEHRGEIVRYLREALVRSDAALSAPSIRARHVTIQGTSEIHLDDEVLPASPEQVLSMHVDTGAVEVLAG